jgi:hypothetical protein
MAVIQSSLPFLQQVVVLETVQSPEVPVAVLPMEPDNLEAQEMLEDIHHPKEIMVAMVFLFPRVEQVPGVVEAALAQLVLMALLAKVEPAVLVHLPQFRDPL